MVQSSNESVSRVNRGINVGSGGEYHWTGTSSEATSTGTSDENRRLRDEIQTVIDLMEPKMPHQTASNDADNEDSFISPCTGGASSRSAAPRSPPCFSSTLQDTVNISTFTNMPEQPSEELIESVQHECCAAEQPVPPHMCVSPDCICANILGYSYLHQQPYLLSNVPTNPSNVQTATTTCKKTPNDQKKKGGFFQQLFKERPCDQKTVNIPTNHCIPPPSIQNDGIPLSCQPHAAKLMKTPPPCQAINKTRSKPNRIKRPHKSSIINDGYGQRRIDFYFFDHGNAHYFHTTDTPQIMICEILAEKTENYTTRFWAELFGSIHIIFSFVMSFILQLFRFILYSTVRPLIVGMMQLGSDYFFKPCLTTFFNAIVQPPLIFLYNVATSVRDLLDPIAEGIGYFLREIAVVCQAIRLVSYNSNCNCDTNHIRRNTDKDRCKC